MATPATATAAHARHANATTSTSAAIRADAHRERSDATADTKRVDTTVRCHLLAKRPTAIRAVGTAREYGIWPTRLRLATAGVPGE